MPTLITTRAIEQSTFAVVCEFTDETGAAVIPNPGVTWTLTDAGGNPINSRNQVAIDPAATVTIVLTGNDLQRTGDSDTGVRHLTVRGTYNSTLGTNLPLVDSCRFIVADLKAVT